MLVDTTELLEGTDGKEKDRLTKEISREILKSFVTDFVQSQEENA